jgi:hypothetical protein
MLLVSRRKWIGFGKCPNKRGFSNTTCRRLMSCPFVLTAECGASKKLTFVMNQLPFICSMVMVSAAAGHWLSTN